MARPKKVLTPAEIKTLVKELKAALKANNDGLKPYKEAVTAAAKAYNVKAKEAGSHIFQDSTPLLEKTSALAEGYSNAYTDSSATPTSCAWACWVSRFRSSR